MSQTRLPTTKDPLADLADLTIQPNIIPDARDEDFDNEMLPEEPEDAVTAEDVFGLEMENKNVKLEVKDGIMKDEVKDNLPATLETKTVEKRKSGKRGKDKKPRKKRQPSASQLKALEVGRLKSLETRRKHKEADKETKSVAKMSKPEPFKPLDYNTFSSYMDMYEEKRKKKHSTSKQPHPNKTIHEVHRPMPPQSKPNVLPPKPRMMSWTGGQDAFRQFQNRSRQSRWNYGL